MAFIRDYAQQHAGDPWARTMRAGRLVRRVDPVAALMRAGFSRRKAVQMAGDPFRFKLPKFIRKFQPLKAIAKVAKVALPLVVPGIGGAIAGALLGGGGGAPEPDAAMMQPEPTGTVGEASREFNPYETGEDFEDDTEDEDYAEDEDEDYGEDNY